VSPRPPLAHRGAIRLHQATPLRISIRCFPRSLR